MKLMNLTELFFAVDATPNVLIVNTVGPTQDMGNRYMMLAFEPFLIATPHNEGETD